MNNKNHKVVNREHLKDIVSKLKDEGKKIVFTNGCFDILHVGHARLLSEAKEFGDILIVGLNSDKSVSHLKPGRPIVPLEQRAELLAAFSAVDYVTSFHEATPYNLIKELKPDVLVKGKDWSKQEIVGSELVKEVKTVHYVPGISTTEIIKRIKNPSSKI
ncbi:MAG: adenylyltransferase/cytidyltransferase family protein [Thermodesulfovibrionia bacterium]|nr:adenylyltransferase/cytidyltransferase family protein [Thermodesulfovibrionia bacterium]